MIPARNTHLLFALAFVGLLAGCAATSKEAVANDPVSVKASTTGRFGPVYSWRLAVNADRHARLTIYAYPKELTREFEISTNQISQLLTMADRERFFDLRSDYGEIVPDGSTDSITITKGGSSHTVRIHFLMNWVHNDPAKLKEPARAVRVFNVVRGWFDDKDAVDLRKYDNMVLEAAEKGE